MKKTYKQLDTEILLVETEGGFMAGSSIEEVAIKVEVDDYDEFNMSTIFD